MLITRTAIVAIALGATAAPALASGSFVPGPQIVPAVVGQSMDQLRATAGPARRDIARRTVSGDWHTLLYGRTAARCPSPSQWSRWGCPRLVVKVRDGVVVAAITRSTQYRTSTGVGVGSTRRQLEQAIPGLDCRRYPGRFIRCAVGAPGRAATTAALLSLGTGRAYSISVSSG